MKKLNTTFTYYSLLAFASMVIFTSCNKDFDALNAVAKPTYPSGQTIGRSLALSTTDLIYYRLVQKAGLEVQLADSTRNFTLFAVANPGMRNFTNLFLTSIGKPALLTADSDAKYADSLTFYMPASNATSIINYNIVGNDKYLSSTFPVSSGTVPNKYLYTDLFLTPAQPFLRVPLHVAKNGAFAYANNVPILAVDQDASNGLIHRAAILITPPSATLKTVLAAKTNLTYFRAAIARADSGGVAPTRFDDLLNNGVLNMGVLAPSDAAFQTLIFGLVYGSVISQGGSVALATGTANGAVAAGPAFLGTNNVSTAQMRGIIAYHIFAGNSTGSFAPNLKVFSVNVPGTPTFIKTLVNGAVAVHPGVLALGTYAAGNPIPTAVTFTGLGTFPPGGAAYSGTAANVIDKDNNAVNGVFHIIDRVLLPQ